MVFDLVKDNEALKSRYERLRNRGFLTQEEMAERLGITPGTVRTWARHGLLNAHPYTDRGQSLYEPPGEHPPRKMQGHKPKVRKSSHLKKGALDVSVGSTEAARAVLSKVAWSPSFEQKPAPPIPECTHMVVRPTFPSPLLMYAPRALKFQPSLHHAVEDRQHQMSHCHDGALFSAARCELPEASSKDGALFVRCCPSTLVNRKPAP
jgi:hypothetical protein